jgi:hypothetical protein
MPRAGFEPTIPATKRPNLWLRPCGHQDRPNDEVLRQKPQCKLLFLRVICMTSVTGRHKEEVVFVYTHHLRKYSTDIDTIW